MSKTPPKSELLKRGLDHFAEHCWDCPVCKAVVLEESVSEKQVYERLCLEGRCIMAAMQSISRWKE